MEPSLARAVRTDAPAGDNDTRWTHFADVLLQRAALLARVTRDRPADPMAGLKVDDDDLAQLLRDLPGLEAADPAATAGLEMSLMPEVDRARADLAASLTSDSPFARLVVSARLTQAEAEVLSVLCAVELDPRRQRLVGYLNDDVTQRRLTPWTLDQLFGPEMAAHLAVGPGGSLRRAALVAPTSESPWASTPVTVPAAVMWWLSGDHSLDPELPPRVEIVAGPGTGAHMLVTAAGPDRLRRLEAAVRELPGELFLVTPPPTSADGWDAVIRFATLAEMGVVVEVDDPLGADATDRIEDADHLPWAVVSPRDLPISALPRRPWFDAPVADGQATAQEWTATFGPSVPHDYHLTADQLHHVGRAAGAMGGDIPAAVRRLAAGHIDTNATRLRPSRTWDDIVLDPDRLAQLREVAVRCRHRDTVFGSWGFPVQPSRGVVALFAGPSGTGKTLAAEVIAADLGVDLYKIDLANLVSKYIGETEKNLSKVFDAAEASEVALFFDEADALLGKRSEVSDAHDRYANIEVAYLLQRLERYDGLVVLASNLANNIDSAFLRRLHVVVEFPMPGPPERRRIWAQCLPARAPRSADLDLDFLADRFELSGGTIRNAALGAAFLAADAGSSITMATAVTAVRRELLKLGRLVGPADFGRYSDLLGADR